MFENFFVKTALERLTHGDTGSTVLGVAAAGLLGSNINYADLTSKDLAKKGAAWGMVVAVLISVVWGYFIGKPKKADD